MRLRSVARAACALLFALGSVLGTTALAQPTATGQDEAEQQAQRQVTQPLNNAPVWNEVRSGAPQTTTVRGRETNVLIQSGGQTWRSLRDGQIVVYGGAASLAIQDGDAVTLGNVRGETTLTARIFDGVRRGVLIAELVHPNWTHIGGRVH